MKAALHGSYTPLEEFIQEVFEIPVSRSGLANQIKALSPSLEVPYQELQGALAHEPSLHIDETGTAAGATASSRGPGCCVDANGLSAFGLPLPPAANGNARLENLFSNASSLTVSVLLTPLSYPLQLEAGVPERLRKF